MPMRIEDVTVEWVRQRMAALRLTQAQVAPEIGLTQDKLSKALTGKRNFRIAELESLARFLCPEEPAADPAALALTKRIEALSEANRRALETLVASLEREEAPRSPQENQGQSEGGQG
jgi:transcriptional regulator with XRE-family HTH domain